MISKLDVGKVLAKCAYYAGDRTPQIDDGPIFAWWEHFQDFPYLTLDVVLDAVKFYYRDPHDRMVQPADISKVARELQQDRALRSGTGAIGGPTPASSEVREAALAEIRAVLGKHGKSVYGEVLRDLAKGEPQ